MEHKWIKFKNGQFGPMYLGDEIDYFGTVLNHETPDEVLINIGVYRLIQFSMDTPHTILSGPTYRLDNSGKPLVYENFEVNQYTIEEVKRIKKQEIFFAKDEYLKNRFDFNGKLYDLRFRNLAYLSIIAILIHNDRYPEEFLWPTADNIIVRLDKNEALDLIEKVALFISDLEQKSILVIERLNAISDITEAANFNVTIT